MRIARKLLHSVPGPIVQALRPAAKALGIKYAYELFFWKRGFRVYGPLENASYRRIMLAIAEETSDEFIKGKVVADFGCGPRGSLEWAKSAAARIGIDVLADRYADAFKAHITSHGMIYLKATEKVIPLPSDYVDVMFTVNAMDHVDDFPAMCGEVLRVLRPGGLLVGSFNLGEPPTLWEPQTLDTKTIRRHLLDFLEVDSYRVSRQGPEDDEYAPFFERIQEYEEGEKGFLWVRGAKR